MTIAGTQRIMNLIKELPDEAEEKIVHFVVTLKQEPLKPIKRTFGTMADDITFIAPDFDSCFDDDPAIFGLEEYM